MNSYLTVRKFLGHPNTCKLLNGWHPLMEKKKMIHLKAEQRKKNPPPPKKSAKTSDNSQQQKFQCKKEATSSVEGQWKCTSHKTIQPGLQNPKDSTGCHGKCVLDGQNHDGITEKGGSQSKLSEKISEILDIIPNFYIAINDMKSHISDENPSSCKNIKTNNLSLRN
ncbi:hypothetical protein O181_023098 [Austropuccinia psidii MF-1]|uniref:Uncharacterized protein n=1 Tax=Austropuccinia psidii MF-1 TaxID=1389203 RepID=A0A9Q3GWZ7_9BASI|nr:hypothetical protein [Austropuccinia psidii MF-1]